MKPSHPEIFKIIQNQCLLHLNFPNSNTQKFKFIVNHFNLVALQKAMGYNDFSIKDIVFTYNRPTLKYSKLIKINVYHT